MVLRSINDGVEHLSPAPRLFITQIGLEPVLKEQAAKLGARLEYGAEVMSLEGGDDGATAVVRDRETGRERTVGARYVVAADGTHSPIRQQLGIAPRGHGSFSESITIYFRADVRELIGERNLSVVYVFGPRVQGFFRFSLDGQAGFLAVNSAWIRTASCRGSYGTTRAPRSAWSTSVRALGAPAELPIEIAAQLASAFHFWTFSRRRRGTRSSPRRGRTARPRRDGGAAAVHRAGRRGSRTRTSSRPIRRP